MFRIHPRQQYSPMRTAQRAVAHGRSQHNRFFRKPVQIRRMHRISLEIHRIPESCLFPETHRMVTHLVWKDVDDVRST